MGPGASIIGSSSVNSDAPNPILAPYAATKAAIANFSASLAQLLGDKGIRVNSVAPRPIWTPLIPSTMPSTRVESFGQNVPLGRAGQPVELPSTSCWPPTRQAISLGRGWPLLEAGRFFEELRASVRRSQVPRQLETQSTDAGQPRMRQRAGSRFRCMTSTSGGCQQACAAGSAPNSVASACPTAPATGL